MALRRGSPLTFRALTLCDTVDGTNGPPGAMANLSNLVPEFGSRGIFISRPAATVAWSYSNLSAPGFLSALLIIGDTAYGMIATSRNAGNDEPFAIDMSLGVGAFNPLTVAGIKSTNTPTSPATTGVWTPPIMKQVGSRIIVTHPGFAGGATKFGWFDVSGFTETTTGNTNVGTPLIDGAPSILGVQPGMTITDSGAHIPGATTVVSTASVVLTYPGTTHTNTTIDGLPVDAARAVGQGVAGAGIPAGATVTVLAGANSVTISAPTTASATVTVTFTGATITMSANAAANATGDTLTIAGGTLAAPLWGAGDTDINNLPSTPVGVGQFNGRAYFACGTDGIVFSDSGFPCRVSNNPNVQALKTNDGLAVTAIGELQLSSLLGGVVQSLIAFEGTAKMQQITGDQTTSNLAMNALPASTGTRAPLSICATDKGLAFISPDGLRIIDFSANVSRPIGENGVGVTEPFSVSRSGFTVPSRTIAAANGRTIMISVIDTFGVANEYWYHLGMDCWTGPHTFASSMISLWGSRFLKAPQPGVLAGVLYLLTDGPTANSSFTENGAALSWFWGTSLLPDSGDMSMIALIEMTLALSTSSNGVITMGFSDDRGVTLDTTSVTGGPNSWQGVGFSNQGGGLGTPAGTFRQYPVEWNVPMVFKQGSLQVEGPSDRHTRIGNLYMRYQHLGYKLQV